MLPVIHIGPLAIAAGPLSLLIALFLFIEIGDRSAKRFGLPPDIVSNVGLLSLAAGLIAARVAYVIANLAAYQLDWFQVLALNLGTLDPTAGFLVALATAYLYLARATVNLLPFADALAPALALALAVLSLGNLLTGDAYGAVAPNLPWAIQLWGEPRHPVQLYELLAYLAIFALLYFRPPLLADGGHFLLAVALLAAIRLFMEPFRATSPTWIAGLRSAQVFALLVMTVALSVLVRANANRAGPCDR